MVETTYLMSIQRSKTYNMSEFIMRSSLLKLIYISNSFSGEAVSIKEEKNESSLSKTDVVSLYKNYKWFL